MKVTGTTLRKRLGRLCSMPRTEESESFLRLISRKPSMWDFHSLYCVGVLICMAVHSSLEWTKTHSASISKPSVTNTPLWAQCTTPSLPIVTVWLIASTCFCWNYKCFTWGGYIYRSSQSSCIYHQCATLMSHNNGRIAVCGSSIFVICECIDMVFSACLLQGPCQWPAMSERQLILLPLGNKPSA